MIRKRTAIFRRIPFVRLCVLSGSCATGESREDSDIDMIVGVVPGRLYLGRAFTLLVADVLRLRNKVSLSAANDHASEADKLCLSLFMSMSDLRMNDPENMYEDKLYSKLIPVYGEPAACAAFLKANRNFMKKFPEYRSSSFYIGGDRKWHTVFVERMLSGKFGDWLEKRARTPQVAKISAYSSKLAKDGRKMRVVTSDRRVETHYRIN